MLQQVQLAKCSFSSDVRYTTHKTLRSKLQQLKKFNAQARIMGLDVGRKYTGVAVSCKQLLLAQGHKTLQMQGESGLVEAAKHDKVGLH